MAKVFIDILTDMGHDVIEASSGKECIGMLAEDKVDLIITDLVMPEMTGLDLLKHMKN